MTNSRGIFDYHFTLIDETLGNLDVLEMDVRVEVGFVRGDYSPTIYAICPDILGTKSLMDSTDPLVRQIAAAIKNEIERDQEWCERSHETYFEE